MEQIMKREASEAQNDVPIYQEDVQAGFLTGRDIEKSLRLQIPELNSGFEKAEWVGEEELIAIEWSKDGYQIQEREEGFIPLLYKCDVEGAGNYIVTVQIKAQKDAEQAYVFLGRRRLYFHKIMKKGEMITKSFCVNVSPIIPRNYTEKKEDTSIDITLLGNGICLTNVKIEKTDCPTIYIAGDSTVTDQSAQYPYVPCASYSGWGQMLSAFVGENYAVSNHAHSGLTTESFRSEGHYQILLDHIQKEDLCLIQFGHNDQKLSHLKAYEGYYDNLVRYIKELRKKGAIPIIVTPLARNSWLGTEGTYNDLLKEYQGACLKISKEYQASVIHLHERSMEFIISKGLEESKRFFYPSDYTHTNDYGAYFFASLVAEELAQNRQIEKVQDSAFWEPEGEVKIPEVPEKYRINFKTKDESLFQDIDRPQEMLTRTEGLEFVMKAMHFFQVNVYNDIFSDVIGHETYAGIVECGVQNGIISRKVMESHVFRPHDTITGKELWDFICNGYRSRKSEVLDPSILPDHFLEKSSIERQVAAEICSQIRI